MPRGTEDETASVTLLSPSSSGSGTDANTSSRSSALKPGYQTALASSGQRSPISRPHERQLVLVVEDDVAIGALLETLLNRAGYRTLLTTDGEAGLSAIARANPDLVLLDVGLPRMDGFEVVRRLRSDPHRQILPVIMLTAHSRTDDVVTGLDAGADDFLSKPFQHAELLARIRSALRLRNALVRMESAHAAVAALANAVEAKDSLTERHCQRLANMALRLGAKLGLGHAELEPIAYGALLHDVGKIGVPEAILTKPAALDADERELMRQHPEIGARICAPLAGRPARRAHPSWRPDRRPRRRIRRDDPRPTIPERQGPGGSRGRGERPGRPPVRPRPRGRPHRRTGARRHRPRRGRPDRVAAAGRLGGSPKDCDFAMRATFPAARVTPVPAGPTKGRSPRTRTH